MYYVYLLKNKNEGDIYYGYTNNLERRVKEHNTKEEWFLVYYEAYSSEEDARKREGNLKHYGQSRTHLKQRLSKSLST